MNPPQGLSGEPDPPPGSFREPTLPLLPTAAFGSLCAALNPGALSVLTRGAFLLSPLSPEGGWLSVSGSAGVSVGSPRAKFSRLASAPFEGESRFSFFFPPLTDQLSPPSGLPGLPFPASSYARGRSEAISQAELPRLLSVSSSAAKGKSSLKGRSKSLAGSLGVVVVDGNSNPTSSLARWCWEDEERAQRWCPR